MATENDADAYFKKIIYSINHPGMNQAEMVSGYNGWAKTYDVEKRKYQNYYEEFLSADTPTSIQAGTYDCVTGAGCFSDNHIPWNTIPELIRVVKQGGLIVIAIKIADTDYYKGLWTFLHELVRDVKLSKVELIRMGRYFKGSQGIVYILTVS